MPALLSEYRALDPYATRGLLYVKTPTGRMVVTRLLPHMLADELSSVIQSAVGIPIGQQRIIHCGRWIRGHSLDDYGIKNGDTIDVVLGLPGVDAAAERNVACAHALLRLLR